MQGGQSAVHTQRGATGAFEHAYFFRIAVGGPIATRPVGCSSDALEPGGSRGVVFLPLWAVLVGYHSLSAEGVSVRWGSLKG